MNSQIEVAGEAARVRAIISNADALLSRALSEEVPPGSAIALGTNLVFFLRNNGVSSGQITLQVREEVKP
jgi:hypothetical protein